MMYSLEPVKQALLDGLHAVGLSQVLWGNFPRRKNSNIPYAQVYIYYLTRNKIDLGGYDRSSGSIRVEICTPYGKDPKQHDEFVDGSMKILSDNQIENVQLFTSYPETLGRKDAWWITRIETPFHLEGV